MKEKAARDPKGTCFGDHKLPDTLGITTFSLFLACLKSAGCSDL